MVQAISNSTAVVLSLQESLWPRLEAVSSNLSNSNTFGYKALTSATHEAQVLTPGSDSISYAASTTTFIDNRGGSIHHTGNTFDVAVQGDGYFRVSGNQYTRNGQFQINSQGQLTTMHGEIVQGAGGSDITIPLQAKHISIQPDGTITGTINNRAITVGKLGVVTFDSYAKLRPVGSRSSRIFECGANRRVDSPIRNSKTL
jgi:flagellar basal-body rod protein FlgF